MRVLTLLIPFYMKITDRISDLIDCKCANWILSMSLKGCSCHKMWNVECLKKYKELIS